MRHQISYDLAACVMRFSSHMCLWVESQNQSLQKKIVTEVVHYLALNEWAICPGTEKKRYSCINKGKKAEFSASAIALTSAELLAQENSIWSSLWWLHYITRYALISS